MPPLTTADIAFLLCSTSQHPAPTNRPHPLTLSTAYGLLLHLSPSGSVRAGLAPPRPAPIPAPAPPLGSSIDEILHTPLTPSPGFSLPDPFHPLTPAPPSSFFSQPKPPPPPPRARLPPPPPPPPAQQRKYLLAPSLHDPGASYLWYAGGWPGNPAPAPPPDPTQPTSRRRRHTRTPPPPHPVPEETLSTLYHPAWFDGYLDWAERLERAVLRQQQQQDHDPNGLPSSSSTCSPFLDEGERVLWTVEGLLLASWLSLQPDVAGVEYRPDGAEQEGGRVYEVRGGDLRGVLEGLFGRGGGECC
ncbi:hypothetical protein QBC39DRAFT_380262 [Podospora conica]|nr:hypothetical protein QBC39DRAFT_380262 [Schizothecium conicum]